MADIVIVGGGAAGMMAAIAAAGAENSGRNSVFLIEKNEKLGKKLFITGKGRCNVTNACAVEDFFPNVMEHAKFLYSAV
ncbi:MAG: NAD(P)/FAD-dependent oxidoreductase, partial [Lachnospiraceae bacterium]|nr:NAD(P)/FAD-dependent oxidoreductase [Lachnospiraceae bacterium]